MSSPERKECRALVWPCTSGRYARRDLNPRPFGPQPNALSTELRAHIPLVAAWAECLAACIRIAHDTERLQVGAMRGRRATAGGVWRGFVFLRANRGTMSGSGPAAGAGQMEAGHR